jgi:hypothetical protein
LRALKELQKKLNKAVSDAQRRNFKKFLADHFGTEAVDLYLDYVAFKNKEK